MTASSPLLIRLVDWYQRAMDGRPSPCRFTPSCSAYAREALELHGRRRGLWLTARRLLRCRPFGPSGFDPVPSPADAPAEDRRPAASPNGLRARTRTLFTSPRSEGPMCP